jgi:hypothetical protein
MPIHNDLGIQEHTKNLTEERLRGIGYSGPDRVPENDRLNSV